MSRSPPTLTIVAVVVVAAISALAGGCKTISRGYEPEASRQVIGTPQQFRAQAMAAADVYTVVLVQALDELRQETKNPDVAQWALHQKMATGTAAFTNATQANDAASLLDMLVLATLKRYALEEHWIPHLLGDEGNGLLAAHRRAEGEVWDIGGKVLSQEQRDELRVLIDQWRDKHQGQYYVTHVRLNDIAAWQNVTRDSPQVKMPSSIFGLLFIDPLSGLDPVAAELQSYRALTERVIFFLQRVPLMLGTQLELTMVNTTRASDVQRFLGGFERFDGTVVKLSDILKKYPEQLKTERTAAIDQASAAVEKQRRIAIDEAAAAVKAERTAAIEQAASAVAAERKAIAAELDAEHARLQKLLDGAEQLVARIEAAGASLTDGTSKTVATTELAAQRTVDRTFRNAALLAVGLLIGIPLVSLIYRAARKGGSALGLPRSSWWYAMKLLLAVLAFVLGIAVTSAVCRINNAAHDANRKTQLLSDVHDPLRRSLDDIVATYDRADASLAERKVRLLQARWSEYLNSGRVPESFSNEIMQLGTAATQPTD